MELDINPIKKVLFQCFNTCVLTVSVYLSVTGCRVCSWVMLMIFFSSSILKNIYIHTYIICINTNIYIDICLCELYIYIKIICIYVIKIQNAVCRMTFQTSSELFISPSFFHPFISTSVPSFSFKNLKIKI